MTNTPRKRHQLNRRGKRALLSLAVTLLLIIILFKTGSSTRDLEVKNAHLQDPPHSNMQNSQDKQMTTAPNKQKDRKAKLNSAESTNHEQLLSKLNSKMKDAVKPKTIHPEIGKVAYLTFDDGPHTTASDEILRLLDKYHAKATFFMLEPHMMQNQNIVKRMVDNGHTVGVHGVTHSVSKIYQSPESFTHEMKQAIQSIKKITGVETHLIRAPYGSVPYITPAYKKAIDKEKMILWDWNIDSEDWKVANSSFVQKVMQQVHNLW
ncbi:polysaccharide deacetylase family protein [Paracerasibacillus soli]|uniref:Polysaccharide deacetylase family protein n=1 Tax=Paracerasibacillus soli TaxID=480284 RepID=A0ABU5CRY1_9BACI|nr:polysaccharide deacetylase family protein [Virgibacillus soli]MDY0409127.1 polysaccharide deacetylase family protein [Virgibacillus soli]